MKLKTRAELSRRNKELEMLLTFTGCTCWNDSSQREGCKFHGYALRQLKITVDAIKNLK